MVVVAAAAVAVVAVAVVAVVVVAAAAVAVAVVAAVVVVNDVPATCYVRMLKSFFKVKRWLSSYTQFFLFCTTLKLLKKKKKSYTIFLNAVSCLLFYSTAFNFIMSSWCQVSYKWWTAIDWFKPMVSVSLFCHPAWLIDQKVGWLTKEPLRYRGVCSRLTGVDTNFTVLIQRLFYHDFPRLPPVCLFVSMVAPSPFPAKHQLNKQNQHDPFFVLIFSLYFYVKPLPASAAPLPSHAEVHSGAAKSFRSRSYALHLPWWLPHTHVYHSWWMGVVYFGAGIRGCVWQLWESAKGWDCRVMWPQLLSPCPDCPLEAQPKYVRGGKRYGRRSLPEFQESVEEFAEVTVIEPLEGEEARPLHIPASDRNEVRNRTGASCGPQVWAAGVGRGCGCPRIPASPRCRDRRSQEVNGFSQLPTLCWPYYLSFG